MSEADRPRLGRLLIEAGTIGEAQLRRALRAQRRDGGLLGTALVRLQHATAQQILAAYALQHGLRAMSLRDVVVQPAALHRLPRAVVVKYRVFPWGLRDGALLVAIGHPAAQKVVALLEDLIGLPIQVRLAEPGEIREYIRAYLGAETRPVPAAPSGRIALPLRKRGLVERVRGAAREAVRSILGNGPRRGRLALALVLYAVVVCGWLTLRRVRMIKHLSTESPVHQQSDRR